MDGMKCLRVMFLISLILLIPYMLVQLCNLVLRIGQEPLMAPQHVVTVAVDGVYLIKGSFAGYYLHEHQFKSSEKIAVLSVVVTITSFIISCISTHRDIEAFFIFEGVHAMLLVISVTLFYLLKLKVLEQKEDSNSIY